MLLSEDVVARAARMVCFREAMAVWDYVAFVGVNFGDSIISCVTKGSHSHLIADDEACSSLTFRNLALS